MSGPRVTSGKDSAQDQATPREFMDRLPGRFGPITFDLAAHAKNARCAAYAAPKEFSLRYEAGKTDADTWLESLRGTGADMAEARTIVDHRVDQIRHGMAAQRGKLFGYIHVPNHDTAAFALDSLALDWSDITRRFGGTSWLNCEFDSIPEWSAKCAAEMDRGARVLLLTPMTSANWARDNILGRADVYDLDGRLSFDGKNVFPKDCSLSHFWPGAQGGRYLWKWKDDKIVHSWALKK